MQLLHTRTPCVKLVEDSERLQHSSWTSHIFTDIQLFAAYIMHDSRAQPGQFLRWRGAGRLCADGTRLRALTKRSSSLSCMSVRYSAYLFCICIRILCKIKSVEAGARLLHIESLGHVHLAGGDYYASLFPEARKGYSNSRETKEADVRFQKFTLDPQRSVAWWTGHIKGGMFTRRSPQFAQAARLDEILVHAGNNQLPQDLEERSAQGFEFHIHSAHHSDSHLDHGTPTADLPVTLLLRPMRAHSSSRDIVDREKWDLMKDSWRAHVKRAGNGTRPCADSMDKLTR